MPTRTMRRPRSEASSYEDESRPSTPLSTAPGDAKRQRFNPVQAADNGLSASRVESHTPLSIHGSHGRNGTIGARKHQPGAIVRVKLTNFVTYTSAEFFPGPNLNMVIGPNGTGKSTLVCAICLGLGWSPNLLGRARDVGEFVKHGAKEAIVEIELQRAESGENKTNRNPIIRRRILKDDTKSAYWINEVAAPHKKVQELMTLYNIQVDNLCQFLPQDRVVEFAQMSPVEMLETTLRAAAHPDVLEEHNALKAMRLELQNFMYNSKGDRDRLESMKKRQEAQQVEVERLRERSALQKDIENHQKCKAYAEYVELKSEVRELRTRSAALDADVARLRDDAAPTLARSNAKQAYAVSAKHNLENRIRDVKRAEDECKRLGREILSCEETIQEQQRQINAEHKTAKANRKTIQTLHHKQGDLKTARDNEPATLDTRAMNDRIDQHRVRLRELQAETDPMRSELDRLSAAGKEAAALRRRLEAEQENLGTQEGQQEDRLRNLSKDTWTAWRWIKDNKDRFEEDILGPPAVTCTVKDQTLAGHLEALMQQSDFKIITAKSNKDFKTLQRHLIHELKLSDVSLRTYSNLDLSTFQKPLSDEQLHGMGLQHWASDCLLGPPEVLAALCTERSLHQAALTPNPINTEQHNAIAATGIRSYVGAQKAVRFIRRAEYGDAGTGAKTNDVRDARVWTNKPAQSGRSQELADQIKRARMEYAEAVGNFKNLKVDETNNIAAMQQEEEDMKDLQQRKAAYQTSMQAWRALPAQIEQVQKEIDNLTETLTGTKDRVTAMLADYDQAMLAKADAIAKLVDAAGRSKAAITQLIEAELHNIEANSDNRNLKELNKTLTETLAAKTEQCAAAKAAFQARQAQGHVLAAACREVTDEANRLNAEGDDCLLILSQTLTNDSELSVKGVEEKIEALMNRLAMIANGLENEHTIREFEERAKQIDKLETKLATFHRQQEGQIEQIQRIRSHFEQQLTPIIQQIDQAFGESFARIGCAGQVSIHKASSDDPADCTEIMGGTNNGLDFANWAIHIFVKFRDNEPLSLLDSHRQSGGERAVSTIFYLMALQSLSKSPFRVVDEINQGMDQRNERMVHGRMVDIAAAMEKRVAAGQASGSQYFLITPKLLSGLKYDRGMTVLCIVSGENMPSATDIRIKTADGREGIEKGRKIDFKQLARKARELGLGHLEDEDRPAVGTAGGSRISISA